MSEFVGRVVVEFERVDGETLAHVDVEGADFGVLMTNAALALIDVLDGPPTMNRAQRRAAARDRVHST